MPIIIEGSNEKYELAPAGTHVAVCYGIYDLGTQAGFEGKRQRKVRICWELSNETMTDGRPFGVSAMYTMSLNDKSTLRKILTAWRGRPFTDEEIKRFDLANLLGVACMITLVHEPKGEKTWANVSSVGALPKGMPAPAPINPLVQFSIGDDKLPDGIPPFIARKIEESEEWRDRKHGVPAGAAPYQPPLDAAAVPF